MKMFIVKIKVLKYGFIKKKLYLILDAVGIYLLYLTFINYYN